MTQSMVPAAETTFKNYDSKAAEKYAAYRPSYNPKLIDLVIHNHTSTGGQLVRVLDIGCGPGIATRQIASHFQHVLGIDASPSMITKAQQTECFSATGERATFQVSNAEDINKVFEPESIDLITIATAAHWFDMPRFYAAAAKVLTPSGSIAMWCGGSWFPDKDTTPRLEEIQKLWDDLELNVLKPFEWNGNRLCRELYAGLPLPWTVDTNAVSEEVATAMSLFDKDKSMRQEFNADGQPDQMLAESKGYMKHLRVTLEQVKNIISTASQVTRWREAHKEKLERGEVEDCVDRMIRLTREELDKSEEGRGREWADVGVAMVLILVKKKP